MNTISQFARSNVIDGAIGFAFAVVGSASLFVYEEPLHLSTVAIGAHMFNQAYWRSIGD